MWSKLKRVLWTEEPTPSFNPEDVLDNHLKDPMRCSESVLPGFHKHYLNGYAGDPRFKFLETIVKVTRQLEEAEKAIMTADALLEINAPA